jgi:hypothetical protein
MIAVSILVTLAGGRLIRGFFSYIIAPDFSSIATALIALTAGGATSFFFVGPGMGVTVGVGIGVEVDVGGEAVFVVAVGAAAWLALTAEDKSILAGSIDVAPLHDKAPTR